MTRVVILEPSSAGCALIERAAELGYDPVVVTRHEPPTVPDHQLGHAREILYVDTTDEVATLRALRALHRAEPLDAIIPGFEHNVPLAAFVAADLGLPGMGVVVARRLRDKQLMRQALTRVDLDQPRHVTVRDRAGLDLALRRIGFPCVVKPVDQSGSLGVRKVHDEREAVEAFTSIRERIGRGAATRVLVEEYVAGAELSVEGYVSDGEIHVLGVTEKNLGAEPSFVEIGHVVPAPLDDASRAEVVDYARRVVGSLGLTIGPFHLELRRSERGPLLMEVGARLPGDRIPDLMRHATGADLYEATLRSFLGQPVAVPLPGALRRPDRCAGIRYLVRADLPSYTEMVVDPRVRRDPAIVEVGALIAPGAPVPPEPCSSSRLAYVIAVAPDPGSVRAALDRATDGVHFEVDVLTFLAAG